MKKLIPLLATLAILSTDGAFADQPPTQKVGKAALIGSSGDADNFCWGIALGGLVALGIMVGVVVGGATSSGNK